MKKFALSLLFCVACFQASYVSGAISPLSESILEINAVLEAASNDSEILQNHFIVDVTRKTRTINTVGFVEYILVTTAYDVNNFPISYSSYLVTLLVTPNVAIGPPTIVVEGIRFIRTTDRFPRIHHHKHKHKKKHGDDSSCSSSNK